MGTPPVTVRVTVRPALLRWACERAGGDVGTFAGRFPRLPQWAPGDAAPTLEQLERFAGATHTPIGYLFLDEPPEERLPIPDFRTFGSTPLRRPSADLLETLYLCQERQEWYRDHARSLGERPLAFVGSVRPADDPAATAGAIRDALGFDLQARRAFSTWEEALRSLIALADDMGVLVMSSGVVGTNSRRPLDPDEFRGFALVDDLAPVVFVNAADTKAAQMFTLAHELAHVWLGESALSDAQPARVPEQRVERWCNQVAAELLVPLDALRAELRPGAGVRAEVERLRRVFKVSSLVVLRRMHDAGALTREQLWREHEAEVARLAAVPRASGGSFYLTQSSRVGKRLARALIESTLEGRTLHRDAFRMLGCKRYATFRELARRLEVG